MVVLAVSRAKSLIGRLKRIPDEQPTPRTAVLLLSLRKAFSSFPVNSTTTSFAENG